MAEGPAPKSRPKTPNQANEAQRKNAQAALKDATCFVAITLSRDGIAQISCSPDLVMSGGLIAYAKQWHDLAIQGTLIRPDKTS